MTVRDRLRNLDSRAGAQVQRPLLVAALLVGFLLWVAIAFGVSLRYQVVGLALMLIAGPLLAALLVRSGRRDERH